MKDISKTIKKILIDRDIQQTTVAERIGVAKQNLSRMLNKDNGAWKISDIEKIADILGYDVEIKFIDRESKTEL